MFFSTLCSPGHSKRCIRERRGSKYQHNPRGLPDSSHHQWMRWINHSVLDLGWKEYTRQWLFKRVVRNSSSSLLMNADVCNILFIQQTHFKCSAVYSISFLRAVQKYKGMLQARKKAAHHSMRLLLLYNKKRFRQKGLWLAGAALFLI